MSILKKISPEAFTISGFIIALTIAEQLTISEQNSIGNWFQLIGQTIETQASQSNLIQSSNNKGMDITSLSKCINVMQEEINKLKKDISK